MAGLGILAILGQLCLQGSNCVLTWWETKYYSQASKQIIVISLAGRWLYFSHVQMEFGDAALVGSPFVCISRVCIWLFVCQSICLYTCLLPACLHPCISYIYCFLYCADVSIQQVFKSKSLAIERLIQVDKSVCTFTWGLCHRLSFNAKNYPGGMSNVRLACFQMSSH